MPYQLGESAIFSSRKRNRTFVSCCRQATLPVKLYANKNSSDREARTPDPLITNEPLYQLSYIGKNVKNGQYPHKWIKNFTDAWSI